MIDDFALALNGLLASLASQRLSHMAAMARQASETRAALGLLAAAAQWDDPTAYDEARANALVAMWVLDMSLDQ